MHIKNLICLNYSKVFKIVMLLISNHVVFILMQCQSSPLSGKKSWKKHFFVSVLQPWFYLPARWLFRLFFLYLFIKKFCLFRNGHPQVFCNKVFLEISQNSQKNTCTKSQNTSCNAKSFAIVMLVFFFSLICLFVYLFIYLKLTIKTDTTMCSVKNSYLQGRCLSTQLPSN